MVQYECKPIYYTDCGGIGHTAEECRRKKYELTLQKIGPKKMWVKKVNQPSMATVITKDVVDHISSKLLVNNH